MGVRGHAVRRGGDDRVAVARHAQRLHLPGHIAGGEGRHLDVVQRLPQAHGRQRGAVHAERGLLVGHVPGGTLAHAHGLAADGGQLGQPGRRLLLPGARNAAHRVRRGPLHLASRLCLQRRSRLLHGRAALGLHGGAGLLQRGLGLLTHGGHAVGSRLLRQRGPAHVVSLGEVAQPEGLLPRPGGQLLLQTAHARAELVHAGVLHVDGGAAGALAGAEHLGHCLGRVGAHLASRARGDLGRLLSGGGALLLGLLSGLGSGLLCLLALASGLRLFGGLGLGGRGGAGLVLGRKLRGPLTGGLCGLLGRPGLSHCELFGSLGLCGGLGLRFGAGTGAGLGSLAGLNLGLARRSEAGLAGALLLRGAAGRSRGWCGGGRCRLGCSCGRGWRLCARLHSKKGARLVHALVGKRTDRVHALAHKVAS
mmetsp:Transcript_1591/g.6367  ORF Transcript_1591/g.6367 Transcript_1591/m.6367 type:complete len:422 (+) Transcript_1591:666-1931(+)